ncbi:MAG: glycosyltransferase family 2 protein [Oscillospiraceae bacterium]|nr:glycosyltransferase family 2 protein [Oscillospiraceae bacterium]
MTFSIVIPVYNVKDYLETCFRSVMAQGGDDYEILLVDDGSTDGESGPLCDRLAAEAPDRTVVLHKPNGGLGDARNAGLERARGEYVLFVDSDDYLLPGLLQALRRKLNETDADVIDFGFVVDKNGVQRERHCGELPSDRVWSLAERPETLLVLPAAWRRLYRRRLFLDHGIRYPARVWYEDIRTTPKLFACAERIAALDAPYYGYVVREGSITRNPNAARNREILEAFDDLEAWFSARGLWEQYQNEFTRLAVDHILLAASVRVLRIDPGHPLLEEFRQYMDAHFPGYPDCPYLAQLSTQHKLILRLLRHKRYGAVRALFAVKDRIIR